MGNVIGRITKAIPKNKLVMNEKLAIITGIMGQDGAFLANHLLNKGYRVIGADRRRSQAYSSNLNFFGIQEKVELVYFDLLESSNIEKVIQTYQPDEFYNLAAQSFVKASFDMPILTSEVDAIGVLRILEAIRNYSPKTKFYQASTSEMYGLVQEVPQKETTKFYPRSPYGVAKLFAHWMTVNYRESYNLFCCSGILFNHESELRGEEFVTQKIVKAATRITKGSSELLSLGNLDAKRDWGYAGDYVEGMHLMLQNEVPDDYILASGKTTSVRDFVEKTFNKLDSSIVWDGEGVNEKGYLNGKLVVEINEQFYRPAEVELLIGDYSKAEKILNWKPKTNLDSLIQKMIDYQLERNESSSFR